MVMSSGGIPQRPVKGGRDSDPKKEDFKTVTHVECTTSVLLKIIRACVESYPTVVTGHLLGLECDSGLEVADCFSLPNRHELWNQMSKEHRQDPRDIEERITNEQSHYSAQMIDVLKKMRVDCVTLGYYQTESFEAFKSPEFVESLCEYQAVVANAVVILHDPLLSSFGLRSFKAYRVSNNFLRHRRDTTRDASQMPTDILSEIPIYLKDSLLCNAFLLEWMANESQLLEESFEIFETDKGKHVKRGMTFLCECLEELLGEQEKLMKYQRDSHRLHQSQKQDIEKRRIEMDRRKLLGEEDFVDALGGHLKRLDPPSPLNTLLMLSRIKAVNAEVGSFAADNITKTILLEKHTRKDKST